MTTDLAAASHPEKFSLVGKRAILVGASRGIGEAIARAFIVNGARLVMASRDVTALERLAGELRDAGGEVYFKGTNVDDASSLEAAVDFAVEKLGGLDIGVNNAAVAIPPNRLADTPDEDFDRIMHTNVRGVFSGMKYQVKAMLANGHGGAIVNTASVGALIGSAALAPYVASKHAVAGLTKSAAIEYARNNVRINAVAPGPTLTDMVKAGVAADPRWEAKTLGLTPLKRFAETSEIANAVVWLCSDASSYVTGITLPVDGGYTSQ